MIHRLIDPIVPRPKHTLCVGSHDVSLDKICVTVDEHINPGPGQAEVSMQVGTRSVFAGLAFVPMYGHTDAGMTMSREHWQKVADQLAEHGIVGEPRSKPPTKETP